MKQKSFMPGKFIRYGYTLIELLLTLFIGVLFITSAVTLLLNYKNADKLINELSSIQENGRIAEIFLSQSIESAGFIGCAKLTASFPITNRGITRKNMISGKNFIQLFQRSPPNFPIRSQKSSDVILIRRMSREVNSVNKLNGREITTDITPLKFKSAQNIIISNCRQAVLARIKNVRISEKTGQIIHLYQPILQNFSPPVKIGISLIEIFYIAKTKRKNKKGDPIYALYQYNGARSTELVSDVTAMKVSALTIDEKRSLRIRSVSQLTQLNKMIGLKVDLSLQSHEPDQFGNYLHRSLSFWIFTL